MSSILYEIKVSDPDQSGMLPPNLVNSEWIQTLRQSAGLDKIWYTPNANEVPDTNTYTIYIKFPDVTAMNNWINTCRMNADIRRDYDLWVSARSLVVTEKYFVIDDSEGNKTSVSGVFS